VTGDGFDSGDVGDGAIDFGLVGQFLRCLVYALLEAHHAGVVGAGGNIEEPGARASKIAISFGVKWLTALKGRRSLCAS